jgi:hypothetical protein
MANLRYPLNQRGFNSTITFQVIGSIEEDNGRIIDDPSGSVVTLFMPPAVQFQDGVSFDNTDLGKAGFATMTAVRNGANVGAAASASISNSISNIKDAILNNLSAEATKLAAVQVLGSSGGVRGGVRAGVGVSVNPHTRAIFERINIREFTFEFTLIPDSEQEAREIKQIVKLFRTELYPETISGNLSFDDAAIGSFVIPLGLKFPNKFRIAMEANGTEFAHKIKDCYITNVNTTYNPTAAAFHADGSPVQINLSMSFKEIETLTRGDVEDGF